MAIDFALNTWDHQKVQKVRSTTLPVCSTSELPQNLPTCTRALVSWVWHFSTANQNTFLKNISEKKLFTPTFSILFQKKRYKCFVSFFFPKIFFKNCIFFLKNTRVHKMCKSVVRLFITPQRSSTPLYTS